MLVQCRSLQLFDLRHKHLAQFRLLTAVDALLPSPDGQYMTIAEVTRIVQAPQESLDHVMGWLSRELDAEHVVVAGNGDLVQAVVPAGALEKALGVEMHIFTQLFTGATVVRSAVDYVLPATIRQHVQLVLGVTDFAPARASTASRTATAAAPDAANTTKLVSPVIQIQTVTSTV